MAAKYVKCLYCGERFDRESVPTKKVNNRRYAHLKCYEKYISEITEEERDKIAFYEYAKKLFGEDYNYILTKKLAERYIKENNYSYNGMLKTLKWYYEKEGNSLEKSNGSIGIIPYVYKKAFDYYYSLFLAQKVNKEKDVIRYIKPKERIITIHSPRTQSFSPHLWFEEEEDN